MSLENFDDVVDAQAIDHNFTTKRANSVLSFSIASLMCLLDNIVAAFSLAIVSMETDGFLFMVTQGKFENFDDVFTGQAIDHNFTTLCANFNLSFSTDSLTCLLDNIATAFCFTTVLMWINDFFMVTGEFEDFDDVVNCQDFSQVFFGCRIIMTMKMIFIEMERTTITTAIHNQNTSNTIVYNSRINIKQIESIA